MKKSSTASDPTSRVLTYAVLIALVAGFLFLRRYFSLIVVSIIIAFIFAPVYEWLRQRIKRPGTAAALTLVVTVLAILVPLAIIILITATQSAAIIQDVGTFIARQNYNGSPEDILNWVNNFLSQLTGQTIAITQEQVWQQLANIAANVASFVLDTITSWVGSIGVLITDIILFMYIFTAVLVHQKKLTKLVEQLNPLGKEVSDLYLQRAGDMTKGMVRGQFIIAVVQGVTSALVLAATGVPYFAFLALILSFMSIIPLGAGIITIPIGIIRILLGDVWQGVVIILNHLLIVTNIDNVLKPILVPKSVKLQPALTLLAVFAGIAAFGFLGIIIGPVIMILIITTIEVYLRTTETTPKQARSKR